MFELSFSLLIPALFLALFRLVRGPTLPDRVVALDLMATIAVGTIAVYAVISYTPILLDVAVVLALIAFLGTVAFAYFVAKGAVPWRRA